MKDAEKIIENAPSEMRRMLHSVHEFNDKLAEKTKQKKLLERILFGMSIVDRKIFLDKNKDFAYINNALPIGKGQTISQPSTVARMLLLAKLEETNNVLEIGTGSGWDACLIAFLVYPGQTTTTERILELTEKAEKNIVEFKQSIRKEYPELFQKFSKLSLETKNVFDKDLKSKFDKIIITAGISNREIEKEVNKFAKNLKEKGILVCPYISGPICIYKKQKENLKKERTTELFSFVPLLKGLEK